MHFQPTVCDYVYSSQYRFTARCINKNKNKASCSRCQFASSDISKLLYSRCYLPVADVSILSQLCFFFGVFVTLLSLSMPKCHVPSYFVGFLLWVRLSFALPCLFVFLPVDYVPHKSVSFRMFWLIWFIVDRVPLCIQNLSDFLSFEKGKCGLFFLGLYPSAGVVCSWVFRSLVPLQHNMSSLSSLVWFF